MQSFELLYSSPAEIKKNLEGATNYVILSVTMVSRRRKFFISNRLKRLEKRNICRRKVITTSINKCDFIKKLFRVSTQILEFFKVYGGLES